MRTRSWIFVTGAPRSGTTFLGRVLSIRREVDYLHEPFNPHWGLPGIERYYLYVSERPATSPRHKRVIERLFEHRFQLRPRRLETDSPMRWTVKRIVGTRSRWSSVLIKLNPFHDTMVIKDPIGCLLTEYLYENYGVRPVIMVRHPVAVIASLQRLGWNEGLDPIRRQRELVEDYFSDEPQFLDGDGGDAIERAATWWRALNKVIFRQLDRHPSWEVVKHEDLCANPVEQIRRLYRALELPWTPRIASQISDLTSARNPVAAPKGKVHKFQRNSRGISQDSLKKLSRAQRQRVYEITKDVAARVYPRETFDLDDGE